MVNSEDPLRFYQDVRVLVLGASGFIGRWVARMLTACGADLWLAVRNPEASRGIFAAYGVEGRILSCDLLDRAALRAVIDRARPAVVFNAAGYGVSPNERDPRLLRQVNVEFLEHLCETAAAVRLPEWVGRRIVHCGSAAEYGDARGDLAEDTEPRPTTEYGRAKLEGTRMLQSVCLRRSLDGVTARLFTVYGPGETRGRLLPSLLEAARTRVPLPLTSGAQVRDFTYVGDVAEGLLRLGLSRGPHGEIVNLATGTLMSVRRFVETAAAVLAIPADLLRFGELSPRPGEMTHDPVRLDQLRARTGWTPPTDPAAGIQKTWNFLSQHR